MQAVKGSRQLPVLGARPQWTVPCPTSASFSGRAPGNVRQRVASRLISGRGSIWCRARSQDSEGSGLPPPPDVIVEVKVDEGDTLESLAQMYHLPYEKLLAANKGSTKVEPGQKLRFSIPMPKDHEELRQLLTPTKELVREALLERAAETGQRTVGEAAEGKQKGSSFQGMQPAGEHIYITTAKYLGSTGGRLLLLGLAVFALVRLGSKLTDRAAAAKSGAAWPEFDDAELTTRFRLKQPEEGATDAPEQGNRGGEASTSTSRAASGMESTSSKNGSTQNGAAASESVGSQEGAGEETSSSEDPAWLALPAVHYCMLPGNQQPCFRVALGHADTRAWLAWQDPDDLRRLLRCMEANGLVPEPAAVRVVACPPYEYLQTAEHNVRPVGFVPKGTLIEEAWHDEQLMEALVAAAEVVPRVPSGVPSSAQSILKRWRQRTGLSVDGDDVLSSGAWEVRSIDEDEEEAGHNGSPAAGRVIEAFTEPLPGTDSTEQQLSHQNHYTADKDESSSAGDTAAGDAEDQGSKDDRTVWQRLRGVKRESAARSGSSNGARSGKDSASQNGGRGGRLSAGRILERSSSKKGTGDNDEFAQMLGFGSGSESKAEKRERPPPPMPRVPDQDDQLQQAKSAGSHQSGATKGGAGSADVSSSSGGDADAKARAQRYAELLDKQRNVADSHSHLDKVRRDALPVDIDNAEDKRQETIPMEKETPSSANSSPAASAGAAADWAQAARRGQRLTDIQADIAAKHQQSQPQARNTGGTGTKDAEWLRLPVVCVPVREFRDGGYGFLTADTGGTAAAEGGNAYAAARPAIVGFADRGDAQQVQWLWDSWPQAEDGANRVLPLPPGKLQTVAQEQGFAVVVFPKGLLPLRPGMSEEQLGIMFSAYASP